MGMITCSECFGKISDKASVCPHCGSPVDMDECIMASSIDDIKRKNKHKKTILGIVIVIIALAFVILGIIVIRYKKEKERDYQEIVEETYQIFQQSLDEYNDDNEELIREIDQKNQELSQ